MNKKEHNFGYLFGVIMLLVTAAVTALIVLLSLNEITAEMTAIFARDGFLNVAKGIFTFLGNISSKLKFGKAMTALSYLDIFCLASSILGFVQGALFKKRDLIS